MGLPAPWCIAPNNRRAYHWRTKCRKAKCKVSGKPGYRCPAGCTCRKHTPPPYPKGKKLSQEHRENISKGMTGFRHSHEAIDRMRIACKKNWRGGEAGDFFYSLLKPVGFVREYQVYPQKGRFHFTLDFAHIEGKVNIELDGSHHGVVSTKHVDEERDAILRRLGWKIIRVKYQE